MVDVPGVDKKDISLRVQNGQLTISVNKEQVKKEEGQHFVRIERHTGHLSRSVALPDEVEDDKIIAENKDGVLSISIPKDPKHANKAATKMIEIK
jgi:HSP20 family protein